jgi:hypothetical protein
MLADISASVQAMADVEFWILAAVLAVFTGLGFYVWKKFFQHARVMEDTPTSKVRSAAQGFVELTGIQHPVEGTPLLAPLSGSACTWWDYKIEKKKTTRDSKGRRQTTWVTVEKDTSVGFFNLRDETGEALVNPRGADVTASLSRVWYGSSRRPSGPAPESGSFGMSFSSGMGSRRYRYTERIMRPGEPIYALGHFQTWSNVVDPSERNKKRAAILAEWKRNPAELVQRFDADGDGQIDMEEWEAARRAAEALVEEHVAKAAEKPDVDILMKPTDGHPFVLATKSQEELTKAYRWKAFGGLVLFLVGLVGLGVSMTARFGG